MFNIVSQWFNATRDGGQRCFGFREKGSQTRALLTKSHRTDYFGLPIENRHTRLNQQFSIPKTIANENTRMILTNKINLFSYTLLTRHTLFDSLSARRKRRVRTWEKSLRNIYSSIQVSWEYDQQKIHAISSRWVPRWNSTESILLSQFYINLILWRRYLHSKFANNDNRRAKAENETQEKKLHRRLNLKQN